MEQEIVVRGTGTTRTGPDRAIVHITIEGQAQSRDDAYAAASPIAGRVDEILTAHAAAIAQHATAALVVAPTTRWHKGEAVRTGWRASRTSVVEVTGFDHLGDLFGEVAAAGAAVVGPSWELDPANPAHTEARRLAAEDARRRADVYAAELGLQITGVAWIAEPGLRTTSGVGMGEQPMFAMARAEMMADADAIDVSPEQLTVEASVDVAFAFRPSG